jgi:ArsR family transcriptional regulator
MITEPVACATHSQEADGHADAEAALPLLKLMSEPNRLRIFALLTSGERCVCEIEEAVSLPQNLVSHHLGVLREAGLIRARREGRWIHYSIDKAALRRVYPAVCRLFNPECVSDGGDV